MRTLITGAAGFIGHNIVKRLLAEGHDVVGIDSFTDYYDVSLKRSNIADIRAVSPEFRFIEDDLRTMDLFEVLQDIDVVFHQAGQPGVRKSWGEEFRTYIDQNIAVTQRLLEAAKATGKLTRFVYASSSSIYGDAERFPTPEEATPAPVSPYGVSKLAAEHLCTLYGKNFGVPTVSLRYFTVYGPGQRPDMAFTRFLRAAASDLEISLYGTGEQIRDFTFVTDIVDANMRAAFISTTPGSVYNVAGGSSVSVNEVLATIKDLSGSTLRIKHLEGANGDVFRTGGSTEAILRDLDWKPTVTLNDGLQRHWEWVKATTAYPLHTHLSR